MSDGSKAYEQALRCPTTTRASRTRLLWDTSRFLRAHGRLKTSLKALWFATTFSLRQAPRQWGERLWWLGSAAPLARPGADLGAPAVTGVPQRDDMESCHPRRRPRFSVGQQRQRPGLLQHRCWRFLEQVFQ